MRVIFFPFLSWYPISIKQIFYSNRDSMALIVFFFVVKYIP